MVNACRKQLDYASAAAERAGIMYEQRRGTAEALPLESSSVDCIVCTLVLCSVRDPGAALAEVSRVLKPGGRFVFVEHVAAGVDQPVLAIGQRLLDPLQSLLADGCHLTRDTGALLEEAASAGRFSHLALDKFNLASPMASLISPHIAGEARVA